MSNSERPDKQLTKPAAPELRSPPTTLREHYRAKSGSDSQAAFRRAVGGLFRVAICLDATGSMAGLIEMAKQSVGEVVRRVLAETGMRIELQIVAYRDYDMGELIREHSPITDDPALLLGFLAKVRADGGGGNGGEAVHVGLEKAAELESLAVILLAGDEPSLDRHHLDKMGLRSTKAAHEWGPHFKEKGVPIHAFVVGEDPRAVRDFTSLAKTTGGAFGRLDGSKDMLDMAVMSILASLSGPDAVRRYTAGKQLSHNAQELQTRLLEGPRK